jgi:hypothetical protein
VGCRSSIRRGEQLPGCLAKQGSTATPDGVVEFCGSEPKVTSWFDSRPTKDKTYSSIKFSTFSLPCFNKFRSMFYDLSGVKFIPDNLEEFLTAKSLAYWVMDDGYQSGTGFYFCTDSYLLSDIHKLANILKNKFDLECGVHKHTNGHRLYIFSSSKDKLLQLIKPYLLTHFYYKFSIGESNQTPWLRKSINKINLPNIFIELKV